MALFGFENFKKMARTFFNFVGTTTAYMKNIIATLLTNRCYVFNPFSETFFHLSRQL